MIPLELLTDGLHAHAGHFPDDIHGHLPGRAHIGVALLAPDIRRHHIVGPRHLVEDLLNGHRDGLAVVQRILDGGRRHTDAGGNALQHVIGVQLLHRAFQLPDILLQMIGNILRHVVGQVQVEELRLPLHDGHAGLEIRRLNVGGQAPLKPGAQPLLQALDLLGRTIRRNDDLPPVVVQRVEGVEEFLLGALLARQELDIVDEQHVRLTVLLPELLGGGRLHRRDDLVGEHFTVHIDDVEIRVVLLDLDLDGVEQMGLAQARRSVDEQRIVRPRRIRRDSLGRRIGKLVGGTLDEVLEGEIVPAAGQILLFQLGLFRLFLFFRGDEHKIDIKSQYRLEGILQHRGVPVRHNAQNEGVADLQRDGVGILKADGFDVADVVLIGCLGSMFTAIGLGRVQYVVDGIHDLRYSPLPVKNRALSAARCKQKFAGRLGFMKGAKTLHTVYHKRGFKTTPYYNKVGTFLVTFTAKEATKYGGMDFGGHNCTAERKIYPQNY